MYDLTARLLLQHHHPRHLTACSHRRVDIDVNLLTNHRFSSTVNDTFPSCFCFLPYDVLVRFDPVSAPSPSTCLHFLLSPLSRCCIEIYSNMILLLLIENLVCPLLQSRPSRDTRNAGGKATGSAHVGTLVHVNSVDSLLTGRRPSDSIPVVLRRQRPSSSLTCNEHR